MLSTVSPHLQKKQEGESWTFNSVNDDTHVYLFVGSFLNIRTQPIPE